MSSTPLVVALLAASGAWAEEPVEIVFATTAELTGQAPGVVLVESEQLDLSEDRLSLVTVEDPSAFAERRVSTEGLGLPRGPGTPQLWSLAVQTGEVEVVEVKRARAWAIEGELRSVTPSTSVAEEGRWRLVWQGEPSGVEQLSWTADGRSGIRVRARSADSLEGLEHARFRRVVNGQTLPTSGRAALSGPFLEVEVELSARADGTSPVFEELVLRPRGR